MLTYDFCVVSPHGAGMQSFLFYLYKMGAPSTRWWAQMDDLQNLRAQYPVCGITIDKALVGRREEFALQRNVPVFWLVRDPIALIASCVNQTIGDAICKMMNGGNASYDTLAKSKNIFRFIENTCGSYCSYAEQLQRIQQYSSLTVIDTSALLPDKICSTMKNVTATLGVPYQESCEKYFYLSYNSFANRSWHLFPKCILNTSAGDALFYLFPSELYEFFLYNEHTQLAICDFEYQEKSYSAISTDLRGDVTLAQKELDKAVHSVSIRNQLIAKFMEMYQTHALTKEHVLEYIQSQPYTRDNFVKRQQPTVALLEKHAPDVLSQWGYFTRLAG